MLALEIQGQLTGHRMSQNIPSPKRIKRHVIGRAHTFYAATPLGVESLCAAEIDALPTDIHQTTITAGGVEFEGRLTACYAANLHLRTPTRILMRLAHFKATNFRQFEKKARQFPWELYLPPSAELAFRAKSKHSRLFHSTAMAKRLSGCIHRRIPESAFSDTASFASKETQRVYIRVVDDRIDLSLDSSGELLFKRGLKRQVGKAPIRENLAASILKFAGYDGSQILLDPMCGSGSFSLEAAMIAKNVPPGYFRSFAFMKWPGFRESQWRHLRRRSALKFKHFSSPLIFASDCDAACSRNLSRLSRRFGLADVIQAQSRDFFDFDPRFITDRPGILVLNPPYGVRLGSNGQQKKFYTDIRKKLTSDYRHWRIALLVKNSAIAGKFPNGWKRIPLFHGGLELTLLLGVFT